MSGEGCWLGEEGLSGVGGVLVPAFAGTRIRVRRFLVARFLGFAALRSE